MRGQGIQEPVQIQSKAVRVLGKEHVASGIAESEAVASGCRSNCPAGWIL